MNKLSQKCSHLDFVSADCHNDWRQAVEDCWLQQSCSVCGQSKRIRELGVLSASDLSCAFRAFTFEILIQSDLLSHLTWAFQSTWSEESVADTWGDLLPTFLRLCSTKLFCVSRTGRGIYSYWALKSSDLLFPQGLQASQAKSQHFGELGKVEEHLCVHPWGHRSYFCLHTQLLIF